MAGTRYEVSPLSGGDINTAAVEPPSREAGLPVTQVNPIQARKLLGSVDYPAGKDEVVDTPNGEGIDENGLSVPRQTPDRQYDGPNAVLHDQRSPVAAAP